MGRKELNPADVYRKQQRKKELKKCKETRNVVRSVQELLSDPNKIEEEIQKAQKESDASALDKGLKDRIKELKMMKSVAITKQKIDIASGKADRDSAAALREAEIQQRDLQRDRRRGLIPNDVTDSSKKANSGDHVLIPTKRKIKKPTRVAERKFKILLIKQPFSSSLLNNKIFNIMCYHNMQCNCRYPRHLGSHPCLTFLHHKCYHSLHLSALLLLRLLQGQ